MEITNPRIKKIGVIVLAILAICLIVRVVHGPRYHRFGEGSNLPSITVTGHGEVNAAVDVANITLTISKDAKTAKEAQAAVAIVEAKVLAALKKRNINEKDIKTTDASFYPKYESRPCQGYCIPNTSDVVIGYTASENITVKIHNIDDTGSIMQDLGAAGANAVMGPNFGIDSEEGLKAQARKLAIEDAKAKAKVLARDLGVHLVQITSFSESGNYGGPIYYAKDAMGTGASAPAPAQLPKGENTITSDVTITYEIR